MVQGKISAHLGCAGLADRLVLSEKTNAPSSGLEVTLHAGVVREDGGGGADFRAHVADCAHAGAADAVDARSMIFHDGSGAALDRQDAGDLAMD